MTSDNPNRSHCPFSTGIVTLPVDGTPLTPSPSLAAWREASPAIPLKYADGHIGWIITRYALARAVLEDDRFSQQPQRMPHAGSDSDPDPLDERAEESNRVTNLLGLDGPQHAKVRRSITRRLSVRAVRRLGETIAAVAQKHLDEMIRLGSPADLMEHYSVPISLEMHSIVLGIPEDMRPTFAALFAGRATTQQRYDFAREIIARRRDDPGEDVVTDLLQSELNRSEIEGLLVVLLSSGRDSVAYMIATGMVALLTHPNQLSALREDPSLITSAVEEFMRFGTMFVTVFPRTATEDVQLEGLTVRKGETVSVSTVAANRDERRFENAAEFDITRDAFGHLGFGHGPHGCLGQQLARAEISEGITRLISTLPTLHLLHAEQFEPRPFAHPVATYEAGEVIVAW